MRVSSFHSPESQYLHREGMVSTSTRPMWFWLPPPLFIASSSARFASRFMTLYLTGIAILSQINGHLPSNAP